MTISLQNQMPVGASQVIYPTISDTIAKRLVTPKKTT